MTDDRAEFAANRDAGLVKRHEQRLARAQTCLKFVHTDEEQDWVCRCGHDAADHGLTPSTAGAACATCATKEPPVTDMVIPPEAVEAAARACHESDFVWSSEGIHDEYWRKMAIAALEAALPHLRPMLELAGNLGRELGRREAAEEILAKAEGIAGAWAVAHIAHEIATEEPK